ncbi:MAG: hypothetical protein ACFCBV_07425 [Phycisphaerales bacterium]
MLTYLTIAVIVLLCAASARGHFLFVHVLEGDHSRIELHFAESAWDFSASDRMVGLVADARSWAPQHGSLSFERRPYAMVAELPEGGSTACATFTYGIMRRGGHFLLEYHAKGVSGIEAASAPTALRAEIVAVRRGAALELTVLFDGQPAANAELVVPDPIAGSRTTTTDDQGRLTIPVPATPVYSFRAMVAEATHGTHDGTEYDEARHYTTLTVHEDPALGGRGSDRLAAAVLADALHASPAFPFAADGWSADVSGQIDGNRVGGLLTSAQGETGVGLGSVAPDDVVNALRMIIGLGYRSHASGSTIGFASHRAAGASARIAIPDAGIELHVQDRRVRSVRYSGGDSETRIDVAGWQEVGPSTVVPSRLIKTEFGPDASIRSVTIIEPTYDRTDAGVVPTAFRGTRIEDASTETALTLRVANARALEPAAR